MAEAMYRLVRIRTLITPHNGYRRHTQIQYAHTAHRTNYNTLVYLYIPCFSSPYRMCHIVMLCVRCVNEDRNFAKHIASHQLWVEDSNHSVVERKQQSNGVGGEWELNARPIPDDVLVCMRSICTNINRNQSEPFQVPQISVLPSLTIVG